MEDQRMKRMKISWKASVFMSFKRKRVSQANMSSSDIYSNFLFWWQYYMYTLTTRVFAIYLILKVKVN